MSETWRDVSEYKGLYQVSDQGRVRRMAGSPGCQKARILKPATHSQGYAQVALSRNGRPITMLVHRLVVDAFIGELGERWVNHRNGHKQDNRLINLEICSPSENAHHAYSIGLQPSRDGEGNGKSKLTAEGEINIRRMAAQGISRRQLCEVFGVSKTTIQGIVTGGSWRHLDDQNLVDE